MLKIVKKTFSIRTQTLPVIGPDRTMYPKGVAASLRYPISTHVPYTFADIDQRCSVIVLHNLSMELRTKGLLIETSANYMIFGGYP